MPRGYPVNPETRARIVELIEARDLSRNAIARECEVSGGTVSAIAAELGIEFDRAKTEIALQALSIDLAVERGRLAKMLMLEAQRSLEDIRTPAETIQWQASTEHQTGGWKRRVLPEPTFADKRNLMTIVGIAVTKVAELTRAQTSDGSPEAITFVDGMQAALNQVKTFIETDPDTDPTVEPANQSRDKLLAEYEADETPES